MTSKQAVVVGSIAMVMLLFSVHYMYERSFMVEGYITSKDYHQAYTTSNYDGDGNYTGATYHSPRHTILIEGKDTRGKQNHRECELSEGEWLPLRVGDRWNLTQRRVVHEQPEEPINSLR